MGTIFPWDYLPGGYPEGGGVFRWAVLGNFFGVKFSGNRFPEDSFLGGYFSGG